MLVNGPSRKTLISGLVAIVLLGVFIYVNYFFSYRDSHQIKDSSVVTERENLPGFYEENGKRLDFHDFEWGSALDTATHLAFPGHTGKQSLKMNSRVNFSPGLWIKFKDLYPAKQPVNLENQGWIRASGYVWFEGDPSNAKCYLVATCNRKGVNYKYMFTDLETDNLHPNQWNRVSIDYRIPEPVDKEDVLQAYFWYRGEGEMLVDDIEVLLFEPSKQ